MTALNIRHYATTIGDGASQKFVIEHDLDTIDVIVQVIDAETFEVDLSPTITRLDRNRVEVDYTRVLVYAPKRGLRGRIKPRGTLSVRRGIVPETNSRRVLISG